jgi:hypothetical protein
MRKHAKIKLCSKNWWVDKYNLGLTNKSTYIVAFIPSIPVVFGLIADVRTIFISSVDRDEKHIIIILCFFLFIYGIINLVLIFLIQRTGIRLGREKRNYRVMHKDVVEKIRDYRAWKKAGDAKPSEIREKVREILLSFNDNYMRKMHREEVSATIKYNNIKENKLYPIRVGCDCNERNYGEENYNDSFVYRVLCEPGRKLRYLYVKDINNPDKYEYEVMGKYSNDILKRSKDKYVTFIALPIRAGRIVGDSSEDISVRSDLGILGFDLNDAYGFGNLEEHELEFISCFADMLSEPVQDLVDAQQLYCN